MSEQLEVLSISEQQTISEALIRMVAEYDGFPSTVTDKQIYWQSMDKDKECVGIYTMPGAVYLKKYVSGSFEAQFPFSVMYKCKPTNNPSRIEKQNVLDSLGAWLEGKIKYPDISDNRTIQSITRTGTSFLGGKDEAGNDIYQCNFNLKYFKKKG